MTTVQTFGQEPNSSLAPPTGSVAPVQLAYTPALSEMALVDKVRDLFSRARMERRPVVTQWTRNYHIMRNRTWLAGSRVQGYPQPEVPECRGSIAQWVAWLTDQRPQFDFATSAQPYAPYADFFDNIASDMQCCVDAGWQTNLYERIVGQATWDAAQFSIGILKTVWNARLADGKGDFDVQRVDPYAFYPDPVVYNGNEPNYFVEARTVTLQELDRRFPGAGDRFQVDGYTDALDERPNLINGGAMLPRTNSGAVSPATTARWSLPGQARERASRNDTGVTLLECWLREHIVSPDPVDKERKRIYEYWRCVCIAGPYVLMDKRADELNPFPIHPYDFIRPEDNGEFYDQSLVELVTPMQVSINRLLAAIENNIALTGNPILIDGSAGQNRSTIRATPGQRIPARTGDSNTTRWLDPPQVNAQMFQLIDFYIGRMEHATGLSAIMQGVAPGGRIASDVLDSVMEAGFVRIRAAQRNMEYALRGVGTKCAAYVAEFYNAPRRLTLIGPEGDTTNKLLRGKHFYLRDGSDEPTPMRFFVQVRAGSMQPTSRNARIAEMDVLYGMGAVDRPVVLEAHNVRNRAAILARIADAEAKGTFSAPGARQRAGH